MPLYHIEFAKQRYKAELKKVIQRKCPSANITVEAQKRIQIWDFDNQDLQEQEVYSGDLIVKLASNSWRDESAEEFCGPFTQQVPWHRGERPVHVKMRCEPMGNSPKCRVCDGKDCPEFSCKKRCPHCLSELPQGHEINVKK